MAGLTQEQLAELTGLSVRAIGDVERGRTGRPHRRSVEILAKALELPETDYIQLIAAFRSQMAVGSAEPPRAGRSAGRSATRPPLGGDQSPGAVPEFARQQRVSGPGAAAWDSAQGPTGGMPSPGAGAAEPVPAQLPADIADFTGRGEQVGRLRRILYGQAPQDSPGAVTVALVAGAGGMGKTTLAVHAAHLLRARFPDGQFYADLLGAGQRPAEPAEILARFLRDLGVHPARIPASEEERSAQYRSRLAGRRVLIVLDDAKDTAQVRPLLPGSASCAVLVTSRSRMPDLAGSGFIDLDVLEHGEARVLFASIIGPGRAEAEPDATGDVLHACAGLPLAIRIAGARLAARGGWSVRSMAARLSDERRRLDELKVGNLAVRASFEVSFASLPGRDNPDGVDPAQAFRLLGLWQGPSIGLPAAAALLGRLDDAVADALEVLVDAQLLQSPASERYRFHDLLRAYAAGRARGEVNKDDRQEAIRRILTWYLHTFEGAAKIISPQRIRVPLDPAPPEVLPVSFAGPDEALNWCEAERAGLVAAVRLAAESGLHATTWKLAAAAMSFFYRRSHWTNWVTITHQIGLASAREAGDRLGEAWMLNNLGTAYGQQRMEESVSCFEQAIALYRELGDGHGEARAANNVAVAYIDLHRFTEALEAAQRSLAIQRQAGSRYGEGIALDNLGCAYHELARSDEAIDCLHQALAIFREMGTRSAEAASLSDLGAAYLGQGWVDQATGCHREALAIQREIGDRRGQTLTLHRLGLTQQRAGSPGEARESLSEALRLLEDLGDDVRSAQARADLATLTQAAG